MSFDTPGYVLFLCAMVILNFALGIASRPLYNALLSGLNMFI